MNILSFFEWMNDDVLAIPSTLIFLGVAIILTIKTRFMQFRAFGAFKRLLKKGMQHKQVADQKTISPFRAMFTAMATTIGMGNIVGPSVAVLVGGPGALFWLLAYIFFASVTKFTEVCFAIETREKDPDGTVLGGPMQYLKKIHPWLAVWYMLVMTFLFTEWSAVQANTLSSVFMQDGYAQPWVIGFSLAVIVFFVLIGGVKRVGAIASKLVPVMFVLYVSFSLFVILKDPAALLNALMLIKNSIFTLTAPVGGFVGASIFRAMQNGIYRGIYITEAGIGTSSIAHAVADVKRPVDQGILAMYSMVSDAFLSTLSGLLVLVTGVWMQGEFRSTLIYEAFKMQSPFWGGFILIGAITLFVVTTVIGNTFNGMQAFSSFVGHKYSKYYLVVSMVTIFAGALLPVKTVWGIMDFLLVLAAVPNLIGLVILAFRYPKVLELK